MAEALPRMRGSTRSWVVAAAAPSALLPLAMVSTLKRKNRPADDAVKAATMQKAGAIAPIRMTAIRPDTCRRRSASAIRPPMVTPMKPAIAAGRPTHRPTSSAERPKLRRA